MATEKFRLPRSSYDQVARIIQAYGQFAGEATLDEVANIAGTQRTVVSANNGFLSDATLLTGGNKKILTDRGHSLAHALQYDRGDEARRIWREVVSDVDFLQSVLSAVRIRRGMDTPTLQTHIAYSAGLPKNKGVMTGAATVVAILEIAGLLTDEEGRLVAVDDGDTDVLDPSVSRPAVTPSPASPAPARISHRVDVGSADVQIQVRINCTPDELDALGSKLRSLLRDLAAGVDEN